MTPNRRLCRLCIGNGSSAAEANACSRKLPEHFSSRRRTCPLQTIMTLRNDDLNRFQSLIRILGECSTREAAVAALLRNAVKLVNAEAGTVAMLRADSVGPPDLVFNHTCGKSAEELNGICLKAGQGLIGWVVSNNKPVIVNDVAHDERFFQWVDHESGFQTRSVICSPVKADNQIIGAIEVLNKKDGEFTDEDLNLLQMAIFLAESRINSLSSLPPLASEQHDQQDYQRCLEAAAAVTSRLLKYREIDRLRDDILQLLVRSTKAQRGFYIEVQHFTSDRILGRLIKEFGADGQPPAAESAPQPFNLRKALGEWFQEISSGRAVAAEVPKSGENPPELLQKTGAASVQMMPLVLRDKTIGIIGLVPAAGQRTVNGPEMELLRTAAESLTIAFEHQQSQMDKARLEQQVLHAQKLESMGELSSGIAHNFRNILAGIIANCQLVQMKYHDHGEMQESIKGIIHLANVGSELVSKLMKFSRKGETRENRTVFNLVEILDEIYQIISTSFDKRIEIRRNWEETIPIEGVRSDLNLLLMNLCTNARDAMPEGGILQVSASVDKTLGRLHLTVSDTGCGMSDDTRKRIFDPFFTTKDPGKGTGLGLSTAYGIVKDHDGDIHVTSTPGVGTIFQVYFPTARAKGAVAHEPLFQITPGNGESVLIVDDDTALLHTLKDLLLNIGYRVETATNGRQGIESYMARRPDAVIIDRNMPGMDGMSVAKHILQVDADAKIIILSGYENDGPDSLSPQLKEAIQSYVVKPFDITHFSQVLNDTFNGGQEKQQAGV